MLLRSASPSFESALPYRDFLPRGLSTSALLAQIQNTVPFIFVAEGPEYVREIVNAAADPERELGHADYFRFCLAAHWATLASFVPTEVENLVRFKLWHPALSSDEAREMAETVLEAYAWDSRTVSRHWLVSPHTKLILSAHHGEWFSVAVAAYVATRKRDPMLSMRLREAIEFEVTRQAKIYLEFRKARDGVGMLLAATLIAHNLGDLDRAIDVWELTHEDPLHEFAYHAAQAEGARAARFGGALAEAGRLNRTAAAENHRHFALKAPRALRRSPDFLLPMAPFFDDWGKRLAVHPALSREDLAGIVEALYLGWEKLKGPTGATITTAYPRAVAGILENIPGGASTLLAILPAHVERNLRSGLFHSLVSVPQIRFQEQWAQKALGYIR